MRYIIASVIDVHVLLLNMVYRMMHFRVDCEQLFSYVLYLYQTVYLRICLLEDDIEIHELYLLFYALCTEEI